MENSPSSLRSRSDGSGVLPLLSYHCTSWRMQSGAGEQTWKPQWFSVLEKHGTKTCTLARNISTYIRPPQPPADGGGKQTWKNVPAEVTVSERGEDDRPLATDKRRFAPRLSSAPTQLLKCLLLKASMHWILEKDLLIFSYVISPLFHAMRFPQQLSLLGVCKGPSSLG